MSVGLTLHETALEVLGQSWQYMTSILTMRTCISPQHEREISLNQINWLVPSDAWRLWNSSFVLEICLIRQDPRLIPLASVVRLLTSQTSTLRLTASSLCNVHKIASYDNHIERSYNRFSCKCIYCKTCAQGVGSPYALYGSGYFLHLPAYRHLSLAYVTCLTTSARPLFCFESLALFKFHFGNSSQLLRSLTFSMAAIAPVISSFSLIFGGCCANVSLSSALRKQY